MPDFSDDNQAAASPPDAAGFPNPNDNPPERTRADEEPLGSLFDDAYALYEDGRTYVEAELAFQKSRATYAAHESKSGIVFAMGALAFLHLALLGLVVGMIIALEPYLGAFGAMGATVGVLILCGVLFALLARGRFKRITRAFESEKP